MSILSTPLRKQLETCIREARIVAEDAAADAIRRMSVAPPDPPAGISAEHKALRVRLRAHGRTLGDTLDAKRVQTTVRLKEAAAYEIWHRMLFGRFLVERGLLLHPDLGAPLTLAELAELAPDEGATDAWALAERYAAATLPAVFKPDDPVLTLPLDPFHHNQLQALVTGLDAAVFEASDSLGWTYQFWRAAEKDAVNKAGGKIGAAELPAVTQLFTESYMVRFLLHNTLGAWWAGKVLSAAPDLARNAADEVTLRKVCGLPRSNGNTCASSVIRLIADRGGPPQAPTPAGPIERRRSPCSIPAAAAGTFWWRHFRFSPPSAVKKRGSRQTRRREPCYATTCMG
jgi:hypothetical protein